jgi:aldehyde:ferredoxin oxidoreductase
VRRKDDTLPDRWFDEPNTYGAYKGEHCRSRGVRRVAVSFLPRVELTEEGIPIESWRRELEATLAVSARAGG